MILLIILLTSSAPAVAQNYQRQQNDRQPGYNSQQRYNSQQQNQQGTADEQTACQGDAVKFCSDAIPYTFRVLACLQRNREQISDGCRYVLQSHGQ